MKTAFHWVTATLSIGIISITAAATAMSVYANPSQVVANLAPAAVAGFGTTLGAAFGGLIVLRFKTVREFIRNIINEHK